MKPNLIFERLVSAAPTLGAKAKHISYVHGEEVGSLGHVINALVFPCSGILSVMATLADGQQVESAMVGRRGAIGLEALFGAPLHTNSSVAQIAGDGWLVKVTDARGAIDANAPLGRFLFRCHECLLAQSQQAAACNAKHQLLARLASWLLRAQDATGDEEIGVTQAFLAEVLGVQRATVSVMANELQVQDVIAYRRGRIRIVDRDALARRSCGCHRLMRDQQAKLLKDAVQTELVGV